MSYGVTTEGFLIKPSEVIQDEMLESFRAALGDVIDTTEGSDIWAICGVGTHQLYELWQALQSIYDAYDIQNASGVQLDNLALITGTQRDPATFTKVLAYCCGTPGTVLASTVVASIESSHQLFTNYDGVITLALASTFTVSTTYIAGDVTTLSSKVLLCLIGGVSDTSLPTVGDIGDNVVSDSTTWRVVGSGTGYAAITFRCSDTGAIQCLSGNLTRIDSATAGWLSVYNPEDQTYLGAATSTDAELKVKQIAELNAAGSGIVAALKSDLEALEGVTDVYILENTSEVTDSYGVPPHSIECIITGGDDTEIATAIFNGRGGGTGTYGTSSEIITDEKDITHTIYFSRPVVVNIVVQVTISIDSTYPVDGDDQIKATLVAYGDANYGSADSVVASVLDRQCWITGVTDVTCLTQKLGVGSLARTTLTTDVDERPNLDTSYITVVHA